MGKPVSRQVNPCHYRYCAAFPGSSGGRREPEQVSQCGYHRFHPASGFPAPGIPTRASTAAATSGLNCQPVVLPDFNQNIKRAESALQHCLLVPRRRFFIRKRTASIPPTRSESVGFSSRFSSVRPCAVATSWTLRSQSSLLPGFQLPADFINHNHFRVVVFHRFNHHFMPEARAATCMRRALPTAG